MAKFGSRLTALWKNGIAAAQSPLADHCLIAETIRLQRLQRRRGHVLRGRIVLLHRGQRFSQLLAQLGRGVAERFEHLLFSVGCHLLLREHIAIAAVHSVQSQHILAAQTRDGAFDGGCAGGTLANLARQVPA